MRRLLVCVSITALCSRWQIRTSVNQLLCSPAEFSWLRHTIITVLLLGATNAFVILVPTIRDIFGFIGTSRSAAIMPAVCAGFLAVLPP